MTDKKLGPYQTLKHEGTYKIGCDKPTIDFKQIGKRGVRRYDGFEKASGKALYTRDLNLPGMLYAKVLAVGDGTTTVAFGKLKDGPQSVLTFLRYIHGHSLLD